MAQYVLLLRDNGSFPTDMSGEEMQAIIRRYKAWSDGLRAEGRFKGGEKLKDREGRLMRRASSGVSVTDGPFAEAKEIIGGFFLIEAASYEDAVKRANDCPHLDFGTIEVREIDQI